MNALRRFTIVPVASMMVLSPAVLADHIPGHSDSDEVFPVPLPDRDTFSGGVAWVHAIGPTAGREILHTVFDITFVSDGYTSASDLLLNIGLRLETGEPGGTYFETIVTGADLGFGWGPGTFHGTFETDVLNGIPIENPLFPPYSSLDIIIGAVDGGIQGEAYFVDSYINFHVAPVPGPAPAALLGAAGLALGARRRRS